MKASASVGAGAVGGSREGTRTPDCEFVVCPTSLSVWASAKSSHQPDVNPPGKMSACSRREGGGCSDEGATFANPGFARAIEAAKSGQLFRPYGNVCPGLTMPGLSCLGARANERHLCRGSAPAVPNARAMFPMPGHPPTPPGATPRPRLPPFRRERCTWRGRFRTGRGRPRRGDSREVPVWFAVSPVPIHPIITAARSEGSISAGVSMFGRITNSPWRGAVRRCQNRRFGS